MINLSYCPRIPTITLVSFLRNLQDNIHHLDLSGLRINDEAAKQIFLKSIPHLYLNNCIFQSFTCFKYLNKPYEILSLHNSLKQESKTDSASIFSGFFEGEKSSPYNVKYLFNLGDLTI